MPATAGRVRMPANNRVHSSAALQTHGIWQSAIGYDPYAPDQAKSAVEAPSASDQQNAYDSFQGLLALARLTGSNADEARGACKKCGRVGHLTFQCRNFLAVKEEDVLTASVAGFPKRESNTKGKKAEGGTDSSSASEEISEEEDESELSDSDEDPEMEKLIASRFGKNFLKSGSNKRGKDDDTRRKHRKSGKTLSEKGKSKHGGRGTSDQDSSCSDGDVESGKKHEGRSRRQYRDDSTRYDNSDEHQKKKRKRHSSKSKKHGDADSEGSSDSNRYHKRQGKKRHGERKHHRHHRLKESS